MSTSKTSEMNIGEAIQRLHAKNRPERDDLASESNRASHDWDLSTGYDKAIKLAEFGWQEKIPQIEGFINEMQTLLATTYHTEYDVAGECVDVGAFLDGTPECMLNFTYPQNAAVRIIANISARCTADAPRLLNRGIAIAAAIFSLQCQGTPVSLAVCDTVKSDSSKHSTQIEVNPFGDYLDPGRLAFWLGHPAALRRCIFRYNEQEPAEVRRKFGFHSHGGYGSPIDINFADADNPPNAYLAFPETSELSKYSTPLAAFEEIKQQLLAQGVSIVRNSE